VIARGGLALQSCALLLACAGAASAAPQAPKQPSKWARESTERTEQAVRERDRELLHPGGALDVVGAEQGDNGFRSSTPALERGALSAAKVDIDELYARRLAMYEESRSFHTPVGPARDEVDGAETARDKVPLRAPEAAAEPARANTGLLLTLTVLGVLGSVWVVQRAPLKRGPGRAPAAH
jgi:hypothetical protein